MIETLSAAEFDKKFPRDGAIVLPPEEFDKRFPGKPYELPRQSGQAPDSSAEAPAPTPAPTPVPASQPDQKVGYGELSNIAGRTGAEMTAAMVGTIPEFVGQIVTGVANNPNQPASLPQQNFRPELQAERDRAVQQRASEGTRPLTPEEMQYEQWKAAALKRDLYALLPMEPSHPDTPPAPVRNQAQEIIDAPPTMPYFVDPLQRGTLQNPLAGAGAFARQQFGLNDPQNQPNPALSPENTPYLDFSGKTPIRNKILRLASEGAGMVPIGTEIAAGTALGGPVGGGMAAALGMGAEKFQRGLDEGKSRDEALQEGMISAGGNMALFSIPLATYAAKYLPPTLASRMIAVAINAPEMGFKMMGAGGVDAASEIDVIPTSTEEWRKAYEDVRDGTWNARSNFLAGLLLGGVTALATPLGRAKAQAEAAKSLDDFIDLGDATVRQYQDPAEQIGAPSNAVATQGGMRAPGGVRFEQQKALYGPSVGGPEPQGAITGPDGRPALANPSAVAPLANAPVFDPNRQVMPKEQVDALVESLNAQLQSRGQRLTVEQEAIPDVPQLASEPTQQQEDATERRNVQALASIDSLIESIAPQGDTFSKQTGKNNIRNVLYDTIGINPPAVPDRYTGKVPEDDALVRIGESRLSERKGKDLDSPEIIDDLTRAIMRRNADDQNMDIDAMLGPDSGLNDLQKRKLKVDAEGEARAVVDSLKRGLADISQAPTNMEPKKETPQPREVTADDLPTAETASQTKWYHGTGTKNIDQNSVDSSFTRIDSLFGSGVYLTDDPNVARTYAGTRGKKTGTPTLYEAQVSPRSILNFEKPLPTDAANIIRDSVYDDFKDVVDKGIKEGKTGSDIWKDLTEEISYISTNDRVPISEYYDMFQAIEGNLRDAGYDAITHVGGIRAGKGKNKHRVLIVLDPQGSYSVAPQANPVTGWRDVTNEPSQAPTLPASPSQSAVEPQTQPEATRAAPEFSDMVKEAQRWRGAAMNVARGLEGNPREALKHSSQTTKGDLDKYLMKKFGVGPTEARDVSNELTRLNLPDDLTAQPEDFAGEPWAQTAPETPKAVEAPVQEAEFVGLQERPRGQAPIALYNIPTPEGGKTTVTAETAKAQGYSVPEPPAPSTPAQAKAQLEQKVAERKAAQEGASPVSAAANRAAMPAQREGTNYEKTLGAIGDTLAENKGVVAESKQPYEMTSEEYFRSELAKNKYKDKYEQDPKAMKLLHDQKDQEWMDMLHAQAEVDALPLNVIDDYAAKFGESFLFRNFRGKAAKGIEGWAPNDVRRVGANDDTFFGFMDGMDKMRAGAAAKALNAEKALPGGKSTVRRWIDKLYGNKELSVSTDTKNKMSKSDREHLENMRARPGGLASLGNIPNKYLDMEAKEKTAYYVNGINLGKTAYDYAQFRLASEAEIASQRTTEPALPSEQTPAERMASVMDRFKAGEITQAEATKQRKAIIAEKGKAEKAEKKGKKRGADPTNPEAGVRLKLTPDDFRNGIKEIARLLMAGAKGKPMIRFTKGLPEFVFDEAIKMHGLASSYVTRMEQAAADLTQAYRKGLGLKGVGKKIPADLMDIGTAYLEERSPAGKQAILASIPPEMHAPLRRMRNLIDEMTEEWIRNDVAAPGKVQKLKNNKGSYVTRQYKTFNDPNYRRVIPELVKERMRGLLRKWHPEIKSDDVLEGLLNEWADISENINGGGIMWRGSPLGARNFDILKQRGDFPQEVLDLWGVERDVIKNVLNTAVKQAKPLAATIFQRNVLKHGRENNYLFTKEDIADINEGKAPKAKAEAYGKLVASNNGTWMTEAAESNKPGASPYASLGVLGDAYASKDFKQAMHDIMHVPQHNQAMKAILQFNGMAKMMLTVASETTQALNFVANVGFFAGSGHMLYDPAGLPGRIKTALGVTATELKNTSAKGYRDIGNRAIALGVIKDMDNSSDVSKAVEEGKGGPLSMPAIKLSQAGQRLAHERKGLAKATGKAMQAPEWIQDAAGDLRDEFVAMYQAGDDFWKTLSWLTETEYHMERDGSTRAQAEETAAKSIRQYGMPYYSETPRAVQLARYLPFAVPFGSYPAEAPRIAINQAMQAKGEVFSGNAAETKMGARRVAGQILAYGTPILAAAVTASMWKLSDKDQETIRDMGPEWDKDSNVAYYALDRSKGIVKYWNLSRTSVQSEITDPINAMLRSESVSEGTQRAMLAVMNPYLQEEVGWKALRQIFENRDDYGRPIWNDADTKTEFATKLAKAGLIDPLTPGTLDSLWRIQKDDEPITKSLAEATGQRIRTVDMNKELTYRTKAFMASSRAPSMDVKKAESSGDQAAIAEQKRQRLENHKREWESLHESVSGMKAFGVDLIRIMDALKKGGMSQKSIRNLLNGVYAPPESMQ